MNAHLQLNSQLAPRRAHRAGLGAMHTVSLVDGQSATVQVDAGGLLTVLLPSNAIGIAAAWAGSGSGPKAIIPLQWAGNGPQFQMDGSIGTLTLTWTTASAPPTSFGQSARVIIIAPPSWQQPGGRRVGPLPGGGGGGTSNGPAGLTLSLSAMSTKEKVALGVGAAAILGGGTWWLLRKKKR